MRLSLFGFNVAALLALVVPAFLILTSMHGLNGASLGGFVGVFGLGSAACLGAMAMLSRKSPGDTQRPVMLLTAGVMLLAVGFGWLLVASLSQ